MSRRSGLGRGLGALIPEEATGDEATSEHFTGAAYRELPVAAVQPNRWQPREQFDQDKLAELAASVAEVGVLQPILVRLVSEDQFELIAGERRWRAAQIAGLATIPALVREVAEQASLEHAIVENLHRSDLNPLEEAAGYQHLIDEFGLTQDAVATRVGRSRSAVTNLLRLFQLPPEVQGLLADRELTAGHGRALLTLDDAQDQVAMARQVVRDGLSVRELERRVRGDDGEGAGDEPAPPPAERRAPAEKPAALLELEQLLENHLQTKVDVSMSAGRGRLTVSFADLDDLERIYLAMVEGSTPSPD